MPRRRSQPLRRVQPQQLFASRPPAIAISFPVVGIGASAGGLDAAIRLLKALPAQIGMSFILIQHLDPTHPSMLVELLAGHTTMPVVQAVDRMSIERDHIYVIPPGTYLSVLNAALHLSPPEARHGARLPFDFLLHSLSEQFGRNAIGIVLSGTGADGTLGLMSIKAKHGLVIAQEPTEAGYDGMPRSAIQTGKVDLVLPIASMPAALLRHARMLSLALPNADQESNHDLEPAGVSPDRMAFLASVIALLRSTTAHDFSLYKIGTLQRRIERRMGLTGFDPADTQLYLARLRDDSAERERLGNDLLINVTRFFRDQDVFETLEKTVIPELVRAAAPGQPIRAWIAGCSTGEETYSLAMLFFEEIARAGTPTRLQIFASDVDPEAVAAAREGLYSRTIATDIAPARLARFFVEDGQGYRVKPELRSAVAFTVHDLLVDAPFSRIDLVSCRNVLIYLQPEAQAKLLGLLHFALRDGGVLLLGGSENVGTNTARFDIIDKSARLYRRTARGRPGELYPPAVDGARMALRLGLGLGTPLSRQASLADLCRKLVVQFYAPAAILINRSYDCLYFSGPTDRYLRVAPGAPSHNLLSMVRPGTRIRLRTALTRASDEYTKIVVTGLPAHDGPQPAGRSGRYSIAVQPVQHAGEELLLVCFIEDAQGRQNPAPATTRSDDERVSELENELETTKAKLTDALRNLETSSEEQNAIHEEALSVNEEFQSTNEELLTSKEELQSLNEELTALNGQLQETLERQRTLANDLQNILYSTDTATLFLDTNLDIRFFTPTTRTIFHVIASDIGRPLSDLRPLVPDPTLLEDAQVTLAKLTPKEQEIAAADGVWYLRRVLPYRTHDNTVGGVVITFSDITERKRAARALEAARHEAELANLAKSRFLAAASHDLRQPLQTLSLLQGLLIKKVEGEAAQKLVALIDPTLTAMSGMLNTLLDINQIDAGTVHAQPVVFSIGTILDRLREEFTYHAQAQGLRLSVISCSLLVLSDPRLLEQMLRNLLSNAFKYTRRGRVLLGCRRHAGLISIEVWDTGIGIAEAELEAIFNEYHQIDNPARERSRGLGLGLPIVQRLAALLGHKVRVRSRSGNGSMFAIDVALPPANTGPPTNLASDPPAEHAGGQTGDILVIEDDPEVRHLLNLLLSAEGHKVTVARDGVEALALLSGKAPRPNLILADFNLPNGINGLQVAARLRQAAGAQIPVIVLTGDIATDTLRAIAAQDCVQVSKPVKPKELIHLIARLLAVPQSPARRKPQLAEAPSGQAVIYIVDDDFHIRDRLRSVLEDDGKLVVDYASCEAFLQAYQPGAEACLLVDAQLPGMHGLQLLELLAQAGHRLPAIMITGNSDVKMAVAAMKAGAVDFIEKPFGEAELLCSVAHALELSRDADKRTAWREDSVERLKGLTGRQRQVMDLVLAGHPSKNIATDLGISQRTVENHRAAIMKKTGVTSLPALARLALNATQTSSNNGA